MNKPVNRHITNISWKRGKIFLPAFHHWFDVCCAHGRWVQLERAQINIQLRWNVSDAQLWIEIRQCLASLWPPGQQMCACVLVWLCDCVLVWLCDCVIVCLCDCVQMTMLCISTVIGEKQSGYVTRWSLSLLFGFLWWSSVSAPR